MTRNETIILGTLSLISSLIFLIVPDPFLAKVYFPIIGIGFTLMGIVKLLVIDYKNNSKREFYFNLVEGLIGLIFGIVYIYFYKYLAVDIVCFILLAIVPILRLIHADHFYNQFLFDILKYIGLFSILGGFKAGSMIFFIIYSIIWFVIGMSIFIRYTYKEYKIGVKDEEN